MLNSVHHTASTNLGYVGGYRNRVIHVEESMSLFRMISGGSGGVAGGNATLELILITVTALSVSLRKSPDSIRQ